MRFETDVPFKNDIKKFIIDENHPIGKTIFRGQSLAWHRKAGVFEVQTKDIESGKEYEFKFRSL